MDTIWTLEIGATEGPRYLAIADAIARGVESGALPEGTRLPTHRALADELGVTVGTVTRGYAEAERRGLTVGEVGRGTFVRQRRDPDDFGWRDAAHQTGGQSGVIDMSLALPWIPPDGEDGRELARTLEQIGRSRGIGELLAYDASTAHARHREAAAAWIGTMGVDVTPDGIVVTNGAQHGMTVAFASLMRPGDTLLAAELTYAGMRASAQTLGLRLHGLGMDHEGIVPEAFEEACRTTGAKVLYCVPTVQNPTTATMSEKRRQRIADIARAHDVTVIEDEIHVAPYPDRPPPIASFAPERTLHITTLSKWVAFGLRIGFIAAPGRAVERLRSGVRSTLWMAAPLMAEIATRWIADGTAARLGERKIRELDARHGIVEEVLGSHFRMRTDPKSLHVWIPLPESLRSDECVAQARQRGVWIAGAEAFTVGRDVPPAVRASIAAVPHREDLRSGLEILREILEGSSEACVDIL